jgi:hypothetical protein
MGTLTGSNTVLAGTETFNLSSPVQTDWIQFPQSATSVNRKSGGGSTIGLPTTIGSGVTFTGYTDGPKMTWTDGTPTASATALAGGIYADNTTATGQGIQIVLPADTTSRTLTIYWAAYSSACTLTATLSDGSATAYTVSPGTTGSGNQKFYATTITWAANSVSQTLTIKTLITTNVGSSFNVMLHAVKYLSSAPAAITGTGASTSNQSSGAAAGGVSTSGAAASPQSAGSATASGGVSTSGSASAVQAPSAGAASGTVSTMGSASAMQAPGTGSASGGVSLSGAGASTSSCSAAAVGSVSTSGTAASIQQPNSAAASGQVGSPPIDGAAAATSRSTASAAGSISVSGSAGATQAANAGATSGQIGTPPISGVGAATAAPGFAVSGGTVNIGGVAAAAQSPQAADANGGVTSTGSAAGSQEAAVAAATGAVLDSIAGSAAAIQTPGTGSAVGPGAIVGVPVPVRYSVAADPRTVAVSRETRSVAVDGDSRLVRVAADGRTHGIEPESRSIAVRASQPA